MFVVKICGEHGINRLHINGEIATIGCIYITFLIEMYHCKSPKIIIKHILLFL